MRIIAFILSFLLGTSASASEFAVAVGRQCLISGHYEAYRVYMPDGYAVRFTCDPRVIIHLQGDLQWGADPSVHDVSQSYGFEIRRGPANLTGDVGASVDYYNTAFLGQKLKEDPE